MCILYIPFTVSTSQQQSSLDQHLSAATSNLLKLEEHQTDAISNSQLQPQGPALEQNQWTFGTQQKSEQCM